MKQISSWTGLFVATLIMTTSMALVIPNATAERKTPSWRSSMKTLSTTLGELLGDLSVQSRSKRVERRVQTNLKRLSELSHNVSKMSKDDRARMDQDVTLPLIAGIFERETKRAYVAYQQGHRTYARGLARQITSYCLACHTRSKTGSAAPSFELRRIEKLAYRKNTSLFERATLQAATRQFGKALKSYQKLIRSKRVLLSERLNWERAVVRALSIAVRVKNDPKLALTIVDTVLATENVSQFMKRDALVWKSSIKKWMAEPKKKALTARGYLLEAQSLLAKALKEQKFPADQSAYIQFLRASSAAHRFLAVKPRPKAESIAEALYIAANTYEVVGSSMDRPFSEVLYEACIETRPNSAIAKQCYDRLEQNIHIGYSGSGGLQLPGDAVEKLDRLLKKAVPN